MPETACSCQKRGGIVFRNARCVLHGDDAIAASPLPDPTSDNGTRWTVDEVDAVTEWLDDNVRTYGAMKPEWAVVKTEEYQRARELIVAVFRDAARVPALQATAQKLEQARDIALAIEHENDGGIVAMLSDTLLDLLTETPDGE